MGSSVMLLAGVSLCFCTQHRKDDVVDLAVVAVVTLIFVAPKIKLI